MAHSKGCDCKGAYQGYILPPQGKKIKDYDTFIAYFECNVFKLLKILHSLNEASRGQWRIQRGLIIGGGVTKAIPSSLSQGKKIESYVTFIPNLMYPN